MVKLCVASPEVSMHGEINIHAQVAIVTKAKLDAISVNGTCNCGDAPAPEVVTDYVIVIDGSDSYNNKGNHLYTPGRGRSGDWARADD